MPFDLSEWKLAAPKVVHILPVSKFCARYYERWTREARVTKQIDKWKKSAVMEISAILWRRHKLFACASLIFWSCNQALIVKKTELSCFSK